MGNDLFCKSVEKDANKGNSNLYIEIYNYGNVSVCENIKKYKVNIKIQESSSKLSETDTRAQDKIAKILEAIEKQQERTIAELKKIGEIIKK